jgi:hypothetical protein
MPEGACIRGASCRLRLGSSCGLHLGPSGGLRLGASCRLRPALVTTVTMSIGRILTTPAPMVRDVLVHLSRSSTLIILKVSNFRISCSHLTSGSPISTLLSWRLVCVTSSTTLSGRRPTRRGSPRSEIVQRTLQGSARPSTEAISPFPLRCH